MSWFAAAFNSLPDPRTGNAKRHDLLEILTMAYPCSSGLINIMYDTGAIFTPIPRVLHGLLQPPFQAIGRRPVGLNGTEK